MRHFLSAARGFAIGAISSTGLFLVTASGAFAAPVACSVAIADNVLPNAGCQVGSINNDNPLPGQVNSDLMFGFSDWTYLAKDNGLDGTDDGQLAAFTISDGGIFGDWTINEPFFSAYSDFMIVLKGGVGNNTQANYVGWLVTAMTGTYTTPFFNATGGGAGNPKNISHATLYARGTTPPPVPLPAAAWLLISGAGALGALRMKRKS